MAVAFTHLSWWLWSGKHQDPRGSNSLSSAPDAELREPDTSKLPMTNGKKMASTSRRVKKKAPRYKDRKVVREYDVVIVPSDGGCFSGSESDDSDWSIGWLEPHGPGFDSDNESDDSFAVLVPCYGRGRREMKGSAKDKLNIVAQVPDNKYMERWLSSLQNS
ncbi:hypothetical protein DCAR_0310803 [Daucus carota subsp. sativus]|uniref:Uncharacterized protein n=1 Tax=Daucus carota subsp. sativus TaxID=79200 RepID=A0AAF0WLY8_DAUCS|nr:PREDICTED: uncharacterized protein LOC108211181 [Daucus carota subsp. sativus]WOG91554.1 hypothetical protein DCAR_0310803 [Daucus carota subsp. sativus]